jgi:ankyrin repeat protein
VGKPLVIPTDDPRAVAAVDAIHSGDVERLSSLLQDHPELATAALGHADDLEKKGMTRTLLHVVTDWPGHFPKGADAVGVLMNSGADVNARFTGPHTETPLHWAASSDDVAVLDALLDHGADIEARGAVIGGGTPISDATAFGQWNAARRLLERGATTTFWESATLGLRDRVDAFFNADPPPSAEDITEAFWGASHGSQLGMAEYLHARGADINWVGWDDLTALDAARRSDAREVVVFLEELGARSNKGTD